MAQKVCFFNHKGGVSKTTNLYHIAWMLSNKGFKVIMVDADSQCNLSTLAMKGEVEFENFARQNPDQNIKDALAPAFHGKADRIRPFACIEVQGNSNLLLIPGSFDISEYEVQLGVSFQLGNTFSTMQNLPGAFNHLIEETAREHEADYVLIDMNPSLSAINQSLFVSSDFFLIPVSPDYFSCMAIRSLANVLPKWVKWAESAKNVFKDADYKMSSSVPKFLGYTINNFTIRKSEPAKGYQIMIDEIDQAVSGLLMPRLSELSMALPDEAYSGNPKYCLGKISDFNTLIAVVQSSGLPIFNLTNAQISSTGTVLETQLKNIETFKSTFEEITNRIITLTEYAESAQPIAS